MVVHSYSMVRRHRDVYPPNTLEQVPPPLPPPLSPPLPSLPLEVGPLLRLGGLGERFSSPSGSGRSPAAKRYLENFRLKISPLVATIFRSFSGKLGGKCINNYCTSPPKFLCFCRNLGGSALIINALPPKFLQKRFPLLFPWCICSIVYME